MSDRYRFIAHLTPEQMASKAPFLYEYRDEEPSVWVCIGDNGFATADNAIEAMRLWKIGVRLRERPADEDPFQRLARIQIEYAEIQATRAKQRIALKKPKKAPSITRAIPATFEEDWFVGGRGVCDVHRSAWPLQLGLACAPEIPYVGDDGMEHFASVDQLLLQGELH